MREVYMENNVILVVDDDTNILAIIEMYLKKEGYTVATCTRGDAAIESFHDVKPTLVLLDVIDHKRDQLLRELVRSVVV